jgi:hypothetical protein
MRASATKGLILLGSVVCSPGIALGDDDVRLADCGAAGASIQREVDRRPADRPITVVIRGACAQDVNIKRDDVTLDGEGSGKVNGTINILGARRVLIRGLTVSSPGGAGIFGTDNAAFTVEHSTLEGNGTEGITVRNGAHATIRHSILSNNGLAGLPDTGRGINATHGGAVNAHNNTIVNNRSDGVGLFNNAYARLVENTIQANGRVAAGEAGVQVNRSRVRAHGNVITNNTGFAAVSVVNHGDYRTGSGLNAVDFPNNEFPFERIEHPVDAGRLALDINGASYGDFRQVHIVGSISVGFQSVLQVRGDDVGPDPDRECSTIVVPGAGTPGGGSFQVSGRNGLVRLRFVNVTPPVVTFGSGSNAQLDGATVCAAP